jgi:hypothetical protein
MPSEVGSCDAPHRHRLAARALQKLRLDARLGRHLPHLCAHTDLLRTKSERRSERAAAGAMPHERSIAHRKGRRFRYRAIVAAAAPRYHLLRTDAGAAAQRALSAQPTTRNASAQWEQRSGARLMSAAEKARLETEFDALMAKAGADVPADRRAGVLAGYQEIKRMTALLRQPRTEAAEPSSIYGLVEFARSKRP